MIRSTSGMRAIPRMVRTTHIIRVTATKVWVVLFTFSSSLAP